MNHICYFQNEDWADYKRYNAVRGELLDCGLPGWADYREKYEAIGYTENDIRILGGWILEDNKKFDYEHLSEIASWKQKPKFDTSWIPLYLKDFLTKKHSTVLFDIWMIFLVVCLFKNNICRFFSVCNLILMMGEYFWLYNKGRVLPRAEYGIILSAIFSLLICFANYYVKKDYNKQFCIRFVAGTLIFSLLFLRNDYVIHYRDYYTGTAQKDWEAQGKLVEKLSQNTDCVYVLNTISFIWSCLYFEPYEKPPEYFLSNFCFAGGWHTNSPFSKKVSVRLGIKNPMEDLLYKENVYYVKAAGDGIDSELLFLKQNYKFDAQVRIEDCVDGYNIYKFY